MSATEKLRQYVQERDRILLGGDLDELLKFMRKRRLPCPSDRVTLLITWHKSITAAKSLPLEYRKKSKEWLTYRGYHSLDDGDL